ncbi:DUF4290 domain-containing protein [Microbacter margulisiae]|nr:DUF4290 domain-containing protein [Microbacter margulisiae]
MDYLKQQTLILPEYGRNIQQMVNHAVQIEDPAQRARCAQTIINIMGSMFPYLRDINNFKHKLWDHLAVMSDFKLDIEYPYEVLKKENLRTHPERIPYSKKQLKYPHYGRILGKMIEQAVAFPEGEQKQQLLQLIANHMKKCYLTWNKEIVDDKKIFDDLRELSHGQLQDDLNFLKLTESKEILNKNNKNNGKKNTK